MKNKLNCYPSIVSSGTADSRTPKADACAGRELKGDRCWAELAISAGVGTEMPLSQGSTGMAINHICRFGAV